jgi:WD40 repeat protein
MDAYRDISRVARQVAVGFAMSAMVAVAPSGARAQGQFVEVETDSEFMLALAFSPDGAFLAGGGSAKGVRLWDMQNLQVARTLEGATRIVRSVAFSPDSSTLAAGGDDQIVYLWNAATGELQQKLEGHRGDLSTIAWSPDGERIASVSHRYSGDKSTYELKLWSTATGAQTFSPLAEPGSAYGLAFSPDGKEPPKNGLPGFEWLEIVNASSVGCAKTA